MTDKQIIIDGIDVSGCCAFSKHREGYCGWYTPCEGDFCSYKLDWALDQLKAKEQECEELNEELYYWVNGEYCDNKCNVVKELDQLKAENEELKDLNTRLDNQRETYWKEYQKLKQTLTEIKEIAEHCIKQDICTLCDNSDKCHIEDEEIPTYDVCKLILQKISEVEDETINN